MNEELKNAFSKLSINEQRNQISSDLIIIGKIVKSLETKLGVNSVLNVKSYNILKDSNLNEAEMLTFIYEDIYNIQKELITLMTAFELSK